MDPNQPDDADTSGDLLVGGDAIRTYLAHLGMPPRIDPYYLKRSGWPIGSTNATGGRHGGRMIASKRRLIRHVEKITRGPTAA